MKIILYSAISIDGYIAKSDDNTDWVSETDWGVFSKLVKDSGAIAMGRRTYEVASDDFPFDCDLNIVMTSDNKLHAKSNESVMFTDVSPAELVSKVNDLGFESLLIIGGGKANAAFLEAGLVDEIILSIHPLILGQGIKIFEGEDLEVKLERISTKELEEGLVQVRYRVL